MNYWIEDFLYDSQNRLHNLRKNDVLKNISIVSGYLFMNLKNKFESMKKHYIVKHERETFENSRNYYL